MRLAQNAAHGVTGDEQFLVGWYHEGAQTRFIGCNTYFSARSLGVLGRVKIQSKPFQAVSNSVGGVKLISDTTILALSGALLLLEFKQP
jgi:hypothetical protein